MEREMITIDGNEAAASVAYRLTEVAAIYPITPASPMAELFDEWSAKNFRNIWDDTVSVTEMQSEGGAAGVVHGALQAGALTTTFTASQGLLLMIPNMYKIAGELTPLVMHVAARTVATHALSIFGDHSDVMACRQTGFALLASSSVQEVHDVACIAHAATLESRIPFLHFFDGFRTSHEVSKIERLSDDDLRFMVDENLVKAHRGRALTPDRPVIRGTAQNPDTFFQAREACNRFYLACPEIVQKVMARFEQKTGRAYHLFDYFGHEKAERIIIIMGSGAETVRETVEYLLSEGEKVGVIVVRLYRPFSVEHFVGSLPKTVKAIAVLDRTKEPGATGEPLYLDVVTALYEGFGLDVQRIKSTVRCVGGRYGLSSKEFTPGMVKAVFDELSKENPKNHFTVGIVDDVTHFSLAYQREYNIERDDVVRAVFFGLGADGTVSANKNSIKIIGEGTDNYAQGYFVYDSKKSGAMTISHLRFGLRPIHSGYLIRRASFVACHQFTFLDKYDVLEYAAPGAVFLLNAPYGVGEVWAHLPREVQEGIIEKKLKVYSIDADSVARDSGMGGRINTIMQTCFFAISGVLPRDEAIAKIKESIKKTYFKKGDEIIRRNWAAVDSTLDNLHEVSVPDNVTSNRSRPPIVSDAAPEFVKNVTAVMMAGKGDTLPVSAFPVDGTWPMATGQWEKRNIAHEVPVWDPAVCIQCCRCAIMCPHATIRAKIYDPSFLADAPASFRSAPLRLKDFGEKRFTIQVAPEDCTGCTLCFTVCPAKDKSNPRRRAINMEPRLQVLDNEKAGFDFFLSLPDIDRRILARIGVRHSQYLRPLFEFSGACAGCGETQYIKLLTQLCGGRSLIANATGCSSIYGGNLPTTPYAVNREGRGPAWSNSLFEDTAEFGLGFCLAIEAQRNQATALLKALSSQIGDDLIQEFFRSDGNLDQRVGRLRECVVELKKKLAGINSAEARRLEVVAAYLVPKSVWIVGGDGWAFDIGYGGLDHVLSMNHNVNILVLDTEVYSNTGGQASKATPLGAAAKFAVRGKAMDKKDLGLMALSYGHVYVASVAMGANPIQTINAFLEAESYNGPSLIIAYSHCIAHGYDMKLGPEQQKLAVESGIWPLYRYDPRRADKGEPALIVDAEGGKIPVLEFMQNETRFKMVEKFNPEGFRTYVARSQAAARRRVAVYQHLAQLRLPVDEVAKKEQSEIKCD
jgi:pyruvate-ferredoxin/flavodoxin oxidoreductase